MKDEIKEILFNLKDYNKVGTFSLSIYDRKILSDYINNLQEENERLKAQNTRYEVKMNSLIQENNVLKENAEHNDKVVDKAKWSEMIYKSRNEKAIEYIKNHTEERCYREPYNIDGMPDRIEYFVKGKWNLLDILQGSDKDE